MPQILLSASEEAIKTWIDKTEFGALKVTMSREYPPAKDREYLMSNKRWDPGPTRYRVEWMKEN